MSRVSAAWDVLRGRSSRSASLNALLEAERRLGTSTSGVRVTPQTANTASAVWAARRLRADLVSSLPVQAYRKVDGRAVEVPTPQVLVEPWPGQPISEWLWASQFDLDGLGNCWGIKREMNALGLPAQVELVSADEVTATIRGRMLKDVKVNGEQVPLDLVWHESAYAPAGSPIGMSPLMFAASAVGTALAAQRSASDWHAQSGAHPTGILRNTTKTVGAAEAAEIKARFRAAVQDHGLFVTGRDWEWSAEKVSAIDAGFLAQMQHNAVDLARFMNVPSDTIDAAMPGSTVTYANMSQRNTQLLVMHMGPAIGRRERALSTWLSQPRYVKLNSDALLRMDPQSRSASLIAEVGGRLRTPSEAREKLDLAPFTPEDLAEFAAVFGQARQPAPETVTKARDGWEAPR